MERVPKKKKGVLGVGNILLGDEGFGVHVVKYIEDHFDLPPNIELLDGGTSGIQLADYIRGCDALLIIDARRLDDPPGTLVQFSSEELAIQAATLKMSPHQVGILEVLSILQFEGTVPGKMDFLCVVPRVMETGLGLSDEIEAMVPVAAKKAYEWAINA